MSGMETEIGTEIGDLESPGEGERRVPEGLVPEFLLLERMLNLWRRRLGLRGVSLRLWDGNLGFGDRTFRTLHFRDGISGETVVYPLDVEDDPGVLVREGLAFVARALGREFSCPDEVRLFLESAGA